MNNNEHNTSELEPSGGLNKSNPFTIPEGYFDQLPGRIQDCKEKQFEARSIYLCTTNESGLKLPVNYFENLYSRILSKIEMTEIQPLSPTLSGIGKKNPFKVPDDYFENREMILPRILPEKQSSFVVPNNYFEELPSRIQSKIAGEKEAKIISFRRYFLDYKYSAVAAAAAIAILIALYLFYPGNNGLQKREMLVSVEDISNAGILQNIDDAVIAEEIEDEVLSESSDDVEEYLIENFVDEHSLINEL